MSYSILAVGTADEAKRTVVRQCDGNSSPEMPVVKAFLTELCDSVEGDDKRVWIDASGWHSGGLVQHTVTFKTAQIAPEPVAEPES